MSPPDAEALPTNWGRWGDRDERGTLNFITDDVRARAVGEARTGHVVSLAYPVTPVALAGAVGFDASPMPAPVLQMLTFNGSPTRVLTDVLVINVHHARLTHIDALAHVPTDDQVYPGIPIAEAAAGGTIRHGSSTAFADGITTRGVFLDLAPGNRLDAGHLVTSADLERAEARAGVRVDSGDALVVRGGWTVADHLFEPLPGMSVDAVEWMADREVSLYAGDICDQPPTSATGPLAMHQVALAKLGLPLIDGADVSTLAATCTRLGRYSFLLVVGTIPIMGATGLPVNPLAIF